jgi:hypothetical protein
MNLTIKKLYILSAGLLISSAVAATSITQKDYYININYGFVNASTVTASGAITSNLSAHAAPVSITTNITPTYFYSVAAGTQFFFNSHVGMRIGPEYDLYNAKLSMTQTDLSRNFSTLNGTSLGQQSSQALFVSPKLLIKPFADVDFLTYVGLKAGLAYNAINHYQYSQANGLADNAVNYNISARNNAFAYGWNIGMEYIVAQRVGFNVGLEQINFNSPKFTGGTFADTLMKGTLPDLTTNNLTTLATAGLVILF